MATNQNDLDRIIATIKAQAAHSLDATLSGPIVQVGKAKRPEPEKSSAGGQTPPLGEVAFRIGVDGQRATAGLLADPYTSRLVYLDKPFLIWKPGQYAVADGATSELVDTQIAPSNSWARIRLYVEATGGPDYSTTFGFHYFWLNDGPDPVVINIDTTIAITGYCFVQGSGGFFGGKKSKAKASVFLQPQRWFGWGTDPVTGTSLDQTYVGILQQSQNADVVSLEAWGSWGLFAGAKSISMSLSYAPLALSFKSLLVPAGASLVIYAGMYLYGDTDGDTLEDQALIDFSNQGAVYSPNVPLTLLTPA